MLELSGVRAGYGEIEVLRGIDLAVPSGAVVALLGANGVGKSTTLRVVAGEIDTRGGSVRLDGARLDGFTPWDVARRGVCLVPEGRGVFPSMSVEDNLRVFADAAGVPLDRVTQAYELFPRLGERRAQLAGTMSGGEQQMLALSRAFLSRPRLLLVDELSSGLAPVVVEELFGRLRELRAAGTTILLVEQYLHHVVDLVDLAYVMAKGRIVFVGDESEVRDAEDMLSGR